MLCPQNILDKIIFNYGIDTGFLYIEVKYTSALKENDLFSRFLGLSSKLADATVSSFPNKNFDRSTEY
jgi:hypothetical protein